MPKVSTTRSSKEQKHNCALCPYSTRRVDHYKIHLRVHTGERPFKCPQCPFLSKQASNLKAHVKNIHLLKSSSASRPFPCPHSGCNYAAKRKDRLTEHSKIHSDEKSFFCSHPNCKYSTNNKSHLLVHTRIHTREKPFVCQFESCYYASAQRSDLVRHSRIHTKEKPFKCIEPNCEYSATNSSTLKRHQLTQHPTEGEHRPSFSCPLCQYKGKSKELLSKHIKTHTLEKHFKCDEPNCNFEARTNYEIEGHKVVHSDGKTFVCSFESCEFRCKLKSNLSRHLVTHSDERIYKCELCSFRGKTRQVVTSHLRNVHSDPNIRPFKCTEPNCDSAFKAKAHLHEHTLVHKGEKKFSCSFPDCDFKAVTQYRVNRHQKKAHEISKKDAS